MYIVFDQVTQLLARLASLPEHRYPILARGAVPLLLRLVALHVAPRHPSHTTPSRCSAQRALVALLQLSAVPDTAILAGYSGGVDVLLSFLHPRRAEVGGGAGDPREGVAREAAMRLLAAIAEHNLHRARVVQRGGLVAAWGWVHKATSYSE